MARPKDHTRRQKIIDSATELFRHFGYEKTTMEDIATKAKITKGALYLEFKNKEEIEAEAIKIFLESCVADMQQYAENIQKDCMAGLKEMILGHMMDVYKRCTSSNNHNPESRAEISTKVQQQMRDFFITIINIIEGILENAKNSHEIHIDNCHLYAEIIVMSMGAFFPPYKTHYLILSDDETHICGEKLYTRASMHLDLVLDGIKSRRTD